MNFIVLLIKKIELRERLNLYIRNVKKLKLILKNLNNSNYSFKISKFIFC